MSQLYKHVTQSNGGHYLNLNKVSKKKKKKIMYPNYIKPIHAKLPDFINLNPIITKINI